MSQSTWYKEARKEIEGLQPAQPAKMVIVNNADGLVETMEKDGWSSKKPKGWKDPVADPADEDLLNVALLENEQLTAEVSNLKVQIVDLTAANEQLKREEEPPEPIDKKDPKSK